MKYVRQLAVASSAAPIAWRGIERYMLCLLLWLRGKSRNANDIPSSKLFVAGV